MTSKKLDDNAAYTKTKKKKKILLSYIFKSDVEIAFVLIYIIERKIKPNRSNGRYYREKKPMYTCIYYDYYYCALKKSDVRYI